MGLLKLRDCKVVEIAINTDEIVSCHIEGGFSYTDYIVTLKNGTRCYVDSSSYYKVLNLASK